MPKCADSIQKSGGIAPRAAEDLSNVHRHNSCSEALRVSSFQSRPAIGRSGGTGRFQRLDDRSGAAFSRASWRRIAIAGPRQAPVDHEKLICRFAKSSAFGGCRQTKMISATNGPFGPVPIRICKLWPGNRSSAPNRRNVSIWTKMSSVPSPQLTKP